MRLRTLVLAAALLVPLVFASSSAARPAGDREVLDGLLLAAQPVIAEPADGYITFEDCDPIITNTTSRPTTITVTICNTDTFPMDVDVGDGTIATIPAGGCRTLIVEIPAGKSLHANRDGKYKLQPSPAQTEPTQQQPL